MRHKLLLFMLLAVCLLTQGTVVWSPVAASEDLSGSSPSAETITLKIVGWTCSSCEKDVHAALMGVAGVQSAEVSYPSGGAIVLVKAGQIDPDQLVQALRGASNAFDTYKATVIPNGSLTIQKKESNGFRNFWSSLFN
ncbi:MAG: cation transporter [Nitrospira sp.]|nr:cation transporter [Nitrospira sp.]MDR4483933.1 cation transporter [Nitrospirales bacterium]